MSSWKSSALLLVVLGCGTGAPEATAPQPQATAAETQALRCSELPTMNADGTATSVGCSFVQHTYNVEHHGSLLATAGAPLLDGSGHQVAQVTHQCAEWYLGVDSTKTTVLLNKNTGEVRSHGTQHAGQELSSLPSSLALPLTVGQ